MPFYDYRCPTNGQVVEVQHPMSQRLSTWGELCEQAGLEPGDTPTDAAVERLFSGGGVVHSDSLKNPSAPACSGGMCGLG